MLLSGAAWKKVDRGQRLARAGRFEEADSLLSDGASALPRRTQPLIQLGLCRLASGDSHGAVEALRKAVDLDSENPAAPLFLSLALSDSGKADQAREQARSARQLEPHNQACATLEMVLDLRQGLVSEALGRVGLGGVSQGSGELAISPTLLGRLVVEIERRLIPTEIEQLYPSQAIAEDELEPAAKSTPQLGESLRSLPRSVRAMRLKQQGVKTVERAMRETAPHGRNVRMSEAITLLRESRELDPNLFRSDFYLAEALLFGSRPDPCRPHDRQHLQESRSLFIDSWRSDGPNPYLYYYIGRCCSLLGEVEAGQEYFRRAIERFEKLPEAHYGLGQGALMLGDETAARAHFLAAVSSDLQLARERLHELDGMLQDAPDVLQAPMPVMVEPEPEQAEEPQGEDQSCTSREPG